MDMTTATIRHKAVRNTIAAEVRAAIARDGRTAAAVARDIGMSKAGLSRKMRGETSFTVEEILNIANTLGTDPGLLVTAAVDSMTAA